MIQNGALQMPQVSDEVIFIALILGIAIFILIGVLVGVVLIHYYEHRRTDRFTLSSLLRTITEFFPKARPKEEPMLSPPAALLLNPSLNKDPRSNSNPLKSENRKIT
ncbi:MAG: hypothetical protein L0Z71_17760 [Anaerolineae bacterium]|nr:hypothetical protein [Anaerolineae bacterium]